MTSNKWHFTDRNSDTWLQVTWLCCVGCKKSWPNYGQVNKLEHILVKSLYPMFYTEPLCSLRFYIYPAFVINLPFSTLLPITYYSECLLEWFLLAVLIPTSFHLPQQALFFSGLYHLIGYFFFSSCRLLQSYFYKWKRVSESFIIHIWGKDICSIWDLL